MYHIKDDKRCRRSADKIGKALGELMAVKPLTDITVSDIQRASGTGRATFYRLFDNIDDVLYYVVEEEFRGMIGLYADMSWREFTIRFIEAVASEGRVIENIVSSGKMHIISRVLRNDLTREAEEGHYVFDNTSKYAIAMFVGCCLSLVTAWDESGREESFDELAGLMKEILDQRKMEAYLRRPAPEDTGRTAS